ncbi:OmpA/MotB family protein [Yoonia litorea]|uniref:Chemotaxis protein MotB n=1 Tax=Yoonia litorea TaxID=1123755 RepID=A0A1I6MUJ4_9RHOB|nr:flagellar motor protein MotB [Yoonia litorea]SFS19301.1 chemotaxis protein MotB [Yoonia litorea]
MADGSNGLTIIKRKKVVAGGGHHGGAWKVAYADFVTAMMAFFMLMWLLNATTEQQRKGIADYFSPTIPINRVSGGGDGAFGGDNIFTDETLAQSGTGIAQPTLGSEPIRSDRRTGDDATAAQVAALRDIEAVLLGRGGESMISEEALRHVVTRLTDEGLIIELFDLPDASLFFGDTTQPTSVTGEIAGVMAEVFGIVSNDIHIEGHLSAKSVLHANYPVWEISTGRAEQMRLLLEGAGLNPLRITQIAGGGDREPATQNATEPRNNRLKVILLREDE